MQRSLEWGGVSSRAGQNRIGSQIGGADESAMCGESGLIRRMEGIDI